jgi:multimeric flavodoxin WrbA
MPTTIALFSSSRRHGNTGAVLDRIAAEVPIEVVDLSEIGIAPYDYLHRNRGDGFEPLIDQILTYDQVMFVAPVYWYAVPPTMKTFIDRLSDLLELPDLKSKGQQLRGKRALVAATSGIDEVSPPFISMFRDTFAYLGMIYGGLLHVNCDGGYRRGCAEVEIEAFISCIRNGG